MTPKMTLLPQHQHNNVDLKGNQLLNITKIIIYYLVTSFKTSFNVSLCNLKINTQKDKSKSNTLASKVLLFVISEPIPTKITGREIYPSKSEYSVRGQATNRIA